MITMELYLKNGEVLTVMMPSLAEIYKLCWALIAGDQVTRARII